MKRAVLKSFFRGLMCPLDFSDPPPDAREPFVALRPMPIQEASQKALEGAYCVFCEGIASEEAKGLMRQWGAK